MVRYLELVGSNASRARAILVDVLGAGATAVELRRQVLSSFGDRCRPSPHGRRPADVAMRRVPEPYLRGLVGGIAELVQEHIVAHGAETLPELEDTLVGLAFSIVGLGTRQAGRDGRRRRSRSRSAS